MIFVVFSHVKSVSAPLRGDVLLSCGFRQHETPLSKEVGIEWRLQHRGKGRKVLEMKTRLDDSEGNTVGKCCSVFPKQKRDFCTTSPVSKAHEEITDTTMKTSQNVFGQRRKWTFSSLSYCFHGQE